MSQFEFKNYTVISRKKYITIGLTVLVLVFSIGFFGFNRFKADTFTTGGSPVIFGSGGQKMSMFKNVLGVSKTPNTLVTDTNIQLAKANLEAICGYNAIASKEAFIGVPSNTNPVALNNDAIGKLTTCNLDKIWFGMKVDDETNSVVALKSAQLQVTLSDSPTPILIDPVGTDSRIVPNAIVGEPYTPFYETWYRSNAPIVDGNVFQEDSGPFKNSENNLGSPSHGRSVVSYAGNYRGWSGVRSFWQYDVSGLKGKTIISASIKPDFGSIDYTKPYSATGNEVAVGTVNFVAMAQDINITPRTKDTASIVNVGNQTMYDALSAGQPLSGIAGYVSSGTVRLNEVLDAGDGGKVWWNEVYWDGQKLQKDTPSSKIMARVYVADDSNGRDILRRRASGATMSAQDLSTIGVSEDIINADQGPLVPKNTILKQKFVDKPEKPTDNMLKDMSANQYLDNNTLMLRGRYALVELYLLTADRNVSPLINNVAISYVKQEKAVIPPPSLVLKVAITSDGINDPGTPLTLEVDPKEKITLKWETKNATNCKAGDSWTGIKDSSNGAHKEDQSVGILTDKKYTLTCDGLTGYTGPKITKTVEVKVIRQLTLILPVRIKDNIVRTHENLLEQAKQQLLNEPIDRLLKYPLQTGAIYLINNQLTLKENRLPLILNDANVFSIVPPAQSSNKFNSGVISDYIIVPISTRATFLVRFEGEDGKAIVFDKKIDGELRLNVLATSQVAVSLGYAWSHGTNLSTKITEISTELPDGSIVKSNIQTMTQTKNSWQTFSASFGWVNTETFLDKVSVFGIVDISKNGIKNSVTTLGASVRVTPWLHFNFVVKDLVRY